MKADIVIIGGGLTALTAGIMLHKAGKRTVIVSAGQSCVQFSSGSFEMLGEMDGKAIINDPIKAMEGLSESHPYRRIGAQKVKQYLDSVPSFMAEAGISLEGSTERNHWRLTPIGEFKPAWLSFSDYPLIDNPESLGWHTVALLNFKGYIDFYPSFLARGLEKLGVKCISAQFTIEAMDHLRKSASEMRATTMARVLHGEAITEMAEALNTLSADADVILMPAVVGLYSEEPLKQLRSLVKKPLFMVPTMPASVPGVRAQMCLRDYYEKLGGTYLLGDTVTDGVFGSKGNLQYINTANMGSTKLEANDFILASGSFFSYGLEALPQRIRETIFDLDTNAPLNRDEWFDRDLFSRQPYMEYGVMTDDNFHTSLNGVTIENLYAAGAVLGGYNPMHEGSGAGVALATAMAVSHEILNKNRKEGEQ